MNSLTYYSLIIVAISALTSVSLGAIHHILLVAPGAYYFYQSFKDKNFNFSKNMSALAILVILIILSIAFNSDIVTSPMKSIFKVKYFLIPLLGIFALRNFSFTDKRIKVLLHLFIISTTIASISGIIGLYTGFNPVKMKAACHPQRTCGVFGMYMTYGYGIGLFMSIMTGFLLYRRELSKWINSKIIIFAWVINLIGLVLSFTRGAWIGFVLCLPFFFLKKHKKAFLSSFVVIILTASAVFTFSPKVREMFLSVSRQESNIRRVSLYKTAWVAFKERPFLGIGYKNLEGLSSSYKLKYSIERPHFVGNAHNNLVEHLATTGALGFVVFLLFHILWGLEVYKRNDLLGYILFPFIVNFSVSGLFQYTFGDGENLFLIMTVWMISVFSKDLKATQQV